jgi:hypothetical protein
LQAETKHVWLDLCSEAAICEDPTRLGQLAVQIANVLQEEQQRLTAKMLPGFDIAESRKPGAA